MVWDFALAPLCNEPLNHSKSALKFFEYAGLGLPGIFSRVGEYAQVIQDYETGLLIDPGASEAWEDAIVEMAWFTALRKKLTRGAESKPGSGICLAIRFSPGFPPYNRPDLSR